MNFSRQEYWSGLPCPPPGDLPVPGIKPASLCLLNWQLGSLPLALIQFPWNLFTYTTGPPPATCVSAIKLLAVLGRSRPVFPYLALGCCSWASEPHFCLTRCSLLGSSNRRHSGETQGRRRERPTCSFLSCLSPFGLPSSTSSPWQRHFLPVAAAEASLPLPQPLQSQHSDISLRDASTSLKGWAQAHGSSHSSSDTSSGGLSFSSQGPSSEASHF